jgi:hypothetical protein
LHTFNTEYQAFSSTPLTRAPLQSAAFLKYCYFSRSTKLPNMPSTGSKGKGRAHHSDSSNSRGSSADSGDTVFSKNACNLCGGSGYKYETMKVDVWLDCSTCKKSGYLIAGGKKIVCYVCNGNRGRVVEREVTKKTECLGCK